MASKHSNNDRKLGNSFGKLILICIVFVFIIFLISGFVKNSGQNNKTVDERLIDIWTTDGVTVYEFDNKGKGAMKLPSSEYKFTYVINDNKLYIDFESEKAIDSDYEYSFENDKLILKVINSTTGTYTFQRK